MIELDDPMLSKDGQLIRGAWTDSVHVYGWVMIHDDPKTPHYKAHVWDAQGRELDAHLDAHNAPDHRVQKFTAMMTLGADGEPKLERHAYTPDQLRARGDAASCIVYPTFTKGVFADES